mmetsp:Transcript_45080/g.119635  ORF Transcript_45080/g.119635 Transcript_45080/m.119635 type:complete len:90 (-) Transcript_45080:1425-1694(-)
MTHRPDNFIWIRRSQSSRLDAGSMPLVGSSRKTMGDSPTRAVATQSLRFCPPERVLQRSSTFSLRPSAERIVAMRSLTRHSGTPRKLEK